MIVMPRRLSDEIASRVRALIQEQQLEAGMKLPAERQLAAQLGVSRNSLREALATLPRPLWISVYDQSNIGGAALARWLASWLPDDIGVLFQDGVGVYARTAPVARSYVDALVGRFGAQRVRIIAEAFRPLPQARAIAPANGAASATPPAAASASASDSPPRPAPAPVFRAATAEELRPQLLAYQGYRVYLFDGPHYVSNQLVERLLQ